MINWFKKTSTRSKKRSKEDESVNLPLMVSEISVHSENENNYKGEIKALIKDIEDDNYTDVNIIRKIDFLVEQIGFAIKKSLLEAQTGYDNFLLLHYAAKKCRPDLCKYLINNLGFDVDVRSKSKVTPLQLLIKSNVFQKVSGSMFSCRNSLDQNKIKFIETFDVLIEFKSDYNAQDESKFTALHHAVHKNNYEAVVILLELENIKKDIEDENQLTPLHLAFKYGHDEIADLLIEKSPAKTLITSSTETLPIHLACKQKKDNFQLIKKILDKIKQDSLIDYIQTLNRVDSNKTNILQISIESNHLQTVECLLKDFYLNEGDEIRLEDRNGNLPIHIAARYCGAEMLRVLIKNNAFSNKQNSNLENALHIAASNNRYKFIREFLSYEKNLIEKEEIKDYVPCVKTANKYGYTPLFVSLMSGHVKCTEALITCEYIDLDAKDPKGNSIYHVCAENNNFEGMRILLSKKDNKFVEPLFIKNDREDNVLHTASSYGNIEIIKLAITRLSDSYSSMESYLMSKNKEGKTCFHIACFKGYFNIVEYLIKDLNLGFFIEQMDGSGNTPLHLACLNGHLGIVALLLECGADLNTKNKDGNTALELSCRLGFFEISKILISKYSIIHSSELEKKSEYPLHIACYEGAYELVELLLAKGAVIDILTEDNKNCLDIAISRGHREVVKVLLKDKNWEKLINLNSAERNDHKINVMNLAFKNQITKVTKKENPQLVAMFENKMWESLKIVLDNCNNGNEFNFKKLDPACKNLQKHPLMLMARSGQETLLKHETTEQLLKLKWRYIPRFAFYSNIFLYLLFLILYAVYSAQLSKFATNNPLGDKEALRKKFESNLSSILIVVIVVNLIKKILQVVLVDQFSFFVSLQNWAEVGTFLAALIAITTDDFAIKLNVCSISVLCSFIVFSFLIQKLKVFGLYVLAFRRTIQNSAKFFPIFFLIYIGFNLSYRVRTNFGVEFFNATTGLSLVRTLSMALGELDSDSMGLDFENIDSALYLNYLIYFMFIGLMCIITFNLFVGIAVGEIKTVLDEADIQQISMRIIFVLKVQETLNRFNDKLCFKWLSIRYEEFNYDNEYKFIKTKDKILEFLSKRFATIEPDIKLVDPSKRLEDNIHELSRSTNADLKAIRELLTNQITDVENKLTNSQQRLEDCLVEMSRKTTNNFETTQEDSSAQLDVVQQKVIESQNQLNAGINDLNRSTNNKIKALKNSYNSQLKNTKKELVDTQKQLESNLNSLAKLTNEMNRVANEQFKAINQTFGELFKKMNELKDDMSNINGQIGEMRGVQQNLVTLNEKVSTQFEDFVVSTEVKKILDDLVDNLIEDSKPNTQEQLDTHESDVEYDDY